MLDFRFALYRIFSFRSLSPFSLHVSGEAKDISESEGWLDLPSQPMSSRANSRNETSDAAAKATLSLDLGEMGLRPISSIGANE